MARKKERLTHDLTSGAPLAEYYDSEDKGQHYDMWCKKCSRGWRLTKPPAGQEFRPGNLLHLLNHAHSHDHE
jgi:hypothetical protein